MQTKSSYRLIKWALLGGVAASLATACVVSEGDGIDDDTDIPAGGDNGSSGGSTSTSGSGGKGGKGGTASTAGSTSTAGTTAAGGMGEGGATYEPGLCEADLEEPTMVPSCAPVPSDNEEANACRKCMKAKCCDTWQTCYGDTPTSACGWGETPDANGQIDCIFGCFFDNNDGITPEADVLTMCAGECTNQCEDLNQVTNDLLACARSGEDEVEGGTDACLDECFPASQ